MNLKNAHIIGTGHYTPEKVLTNKDLSEMLDVSEEWIYSRTGINSRFVVEKEQKTSDLAMKASLDAINKAQINPSEIDLIIFCTITPDKLCPSTACNLQKLIKADNAASFDLVSACSGFIFGLATAYQYIATGMYETVLVVGADILSKYTNYEDKSTCILFGDGAGAAIIKRSDENSFLDFKLKTESNINDLIHIPSTGTEISDLPPFLTMKGKEVFKWAVNTIPDMICDSISKINLNIDDIDYFFLHQANNRITESIRKKLDISTSKFPSNIETHGNTSAASVPILLSQSIDSGLIKKGNKLLLAGFGAGISSATCILEWKI